MPDTLPNNDKTLSQRFLGAHSWVGLVAAAFLYILCFSGVISVLGQELERWEQPGIDEFQQYSPEFIDKVYRQFIAKHPEETEHIHVVFPREAIPRIVIENDHEAFFVNHDGSIGEKEYAPWTKMVSSLHTELHLPHTIGTIVSGIIAALLLMLIVSGVVAHKTIFKEAFRLRLGRSKLAQNIDWHNRLSVWGLPFHLMIALTSCYFGLVGILLAIAANVFHDNDRSRIIELVFGAEPQLIEQPAVANVAASIENLRKLAPDAQPIFMTIHEAGTEKQFIEFYVMKDERLIYSENFRFAANGEFIARVDPDKLDLGPQILLSTYRLHFGDFAGFGIKLLYLLLGAALTYIAVSGVNIWLNKRRHKDAINTLWGAFVWGLPLGLASSFFFAQTLALSPTVMLWLSLLGSCSLSLFWQKISSRISFERLLQGVALGFCMASILAFSMKHFNADSAMDFWSMILFLASASVLSYVVYRRNQPAEAPTH